MAGSTANSLRLLKGVAIRVRGRFRIKKCIVESLRDELGKEYFDRLPSEQKHHRISFGAVSFKKIDDRSAMLEKVHLAHCKNDCYHFEYSESNGPIYDERGKRYPFIKFDQDVTHILEKISSPANRALEVVYTLRSPKMALPVNLRTLKVGRLRLGGIKLLVRSEEGDQVSFLFDWEDRKSLTAIVRTRRKMAITTEWPAPLLARLTELMQGLRKGGLEYDITAQA
ncbi:hypothetical protein FJY63_03850 [Candidatus Sumerlaeota bacterium]|nr:hypothetical protein [Candidatus Sumerlaeota bacterium]